ncbi:MAG: type VI secretion system lipoprotein TssJ [Rhodanobacter sp.]
MDMHFIARRYRCCFVATVLLLGGCASVSKPTPVSAGDAVGQAQPSTKPFERMMQAVGLAKDTVPPPTEKQIPLRIFTAQNLNAGAGSKPLALVVKVYHLRSLERFKQTPFDDFLDKSKTEAALGADLIDSREMLLLPEQRYISTEHMPLDTRYLGFVALFRAPAAQRWRFAYELSSSMESGITLGVHSCAMSSTAGALVTELPDDAGALSSVHCTKPGI